jgi:hypothetical protein
MKAMGLNKPSKGATPGAEVTPEPGVRVVKGRFNSATTSTKTAEEIVSEVVRVLEDNGVCETRQLLFAA